MKQSFRLLMAALVIALPAQVAAQTNIDAILADSSRPEADRERDAGRAPGEVIAFLGIGPGDSVADLLAGGGYYTRILVPLVGAEGQVYAGNNPFFAGFFGEAFDALLNEPAFSSVIRIDSPVDELTLPANSLDAAIMSQAYHDLVLGDEDRDEMNRRIFAALKSGGVYGIIDHAAAPGSGISATESLHRIDKQFVIDEVTRARFVLAGDADILSNPDDDHSAMIFSPDINGQTDRFVLRFEKP
ncbi:MAG: SAM-dependent methyltransferase [Gammaproteobacteria bacterium]|nr:SAM-dependent methyltransferase [Gammaproteobacteria bacterium]